MRPIAFRVPILVVCSAIVLSACGPKDAGSDAYAGGASPAAATTGPQAVAQNAAPVDTRVGTPVPATGVAPSRIDDTQAQANDAPVRVAPAPAAPIAPTRVAQATDVPPRAATPVERRAVDPRPVERVLTGSIEHIAPVREQRPATGAGAVIGGVIGGVIGNQFGHGKGRVATTGLGAVGGAVAGHEIEKRRNDDVVGYRVSIRLDNGTIRTFERSQVGNFQVGDRVRVEGGGFHRV